LRSLKLYLNSFRSASLSHEDATNTIYSVLKKKLKPKFLEVVGDFNPRGNMKTIIKVSSEIEAKATGKNKKK
jgi:7-cyano-7-deazaguanine reductase